MNPRLDEVREWLQKAEKDLLYHPYKCLSLLEA